MDTTYIRSRTILLGTKREGQAKIEKNKERKNEIFRICKKQVMIMHLDLTMKLIKNYLVNL